MRISRSTIVKQSRLAGFFLCWVWLSACTEVATDKTSLELQQAKVAEQNGLHSIALPLYQKAAVKGEVDAVSAVLRLTRSDVSIVAQAQWLDSLPLSAQQRQPFLAQLGLWQQLQPAAAAHYQQPWQRLFAANSNSDASSASPRHPASADAQCALKLQPVLSTEQSATQWLHLLQQWQQDPQLSSLAICLNAPVFVDAAELACSDQQGERIACDSKVLRQALLQMSATQVLVLAGKGGASYNNGWLQLPENASFPLFRHELSHLFGFVDEYPLAATIAASECQPGRITPNLLFATSDLPAYLARWQINASQVELTAVNSCVHTASQAYRVVREDSHLQHYELAMPDLYLQLMHKQLEQPEQLMPVAYYFAYLSRQEGDWRGWQHWMQLAASAGYPPALEALAEASAKGGRHSAR